MIRAASSTFIGQRNRRYEQKKCIGDICIEKTVREKIKTRLRTSCCVPHVGSAGHQGGRQAMGLTMHVHRHTPSSSFAFLVVERCLFRCCCTGATPLSMSALTTECKSPIVCLLTVLSMQSNRSHELYVGVYHSVHRCHLVWTGSIYLHFSRLTVLHYSTILQKVSSTDRFASR